MKSIVRMSFRSVAVTAALLVVALAGLTLSLWGTAHAAAGFGSVQVTVLVSGGTANPSDFTVHINKNGAGNVGTLSGSGNSITFSLVSGTYTLSETGPAGYTTSWSGDCSAQGVITVGSNTSASCTVTNTFSNLGTIKVMEVVSGGTANPSNFTVHIKKSSAVDTGSPSGSGSVITFGQLTPGSYTIIQSGGPTGYTTTWSGACNSQGTITVTANNTSVCTITNTFITTGGGGGTTDRGTRTTPTRPTR